MCVSLCYVGVFKAKSGIQLVALAEGALAEGFFLVREGRIAGTVRCVLLQPIPAHMRLSVDCLFLRSPSQVPYRTLYLLIVYF